MKHRLAPLAVVALLLLTGCSSPTGTDTGTAQSSGSPRERAAEETQAPPAEPLDLTGEWKQTNSNAEDSYQAATISDGQILINWVNVQESTTAIYWVGAYVAPTEDVTTYSWDSANDTAQTENALLASSDPTKTFTYENDVLRYELTALGVTMTVEMSRQ